MNKNAIERFHKAYIESNTVELERLWNDVAPKTLVKFYPAQYLPDGHNYSIDSIINKKLWISSPRHFNDPFDSVMNIDYRPELSVLASQVMVDLFGEQRAHELMDTPIFKAAVQSAHIQVQTGLAQRNSDIEKGIFVSCFTEKENIRSTCMWAHYADNHSGFCAEFEFNDIKNAGDYGCFPIKYTDEYVLHDNPSSLRESIEFLLNLVFTKSKSWKNEKEWRIVKLQDAVNSDGGLIDFVLPKKVYLGCKVKDRLKKDLCLFCHENKIPIYQMKLKPGSFNIKKEKLNI